MAAAYNWKPSTRFEKDPWFLFKYDAGWLLVLVAASAGLWSSGWSGLSVSTTDLLLFLPAACYFSVLGHVLVHNAAHGNLPPILNGLVGELGGLFVGTRFAAWDILHQRHHRFPDHPEKDPHPVQKNFLAFVVFKMIGNLEPNIQQQFHELFGHAPLRVWQAKLRTVLGVIATGALLVFWFVLLGPRAFVFLFVPATTLSALYVAHFNWVTHDAKNKDGDYRPIDLDHGYYWFANRALFGLYCHATHHDRPHLFNPLKGRA